MEGGTARHGQGSSLTSTIFAMPSVSMPTALISTSPADPMPGVVQCRLRGDPAAHRVADDHDVIAQVERVEEFEVRQGEVR